MDGAEARGSEEQALRISEGVVRAKALWWVGGRGPGCGRGGWQQCGKGREVGRADERGSGEKLLPTPCLLFE